MRHKYVNYPFYLAIGAYVLILLLFAVTSASSFANIMVGTFPLLVYLVILYLFLHLHKLHTFLFWLISLALPILYYFLWLSRAHPTLQEIDGGALLFWQLIFIVILNTLVFIAHPNEAPPHLQKKTVQNATLQHQNQQLQQHMHHLQSELHKTKKQLEISAENFTVTLRSIEDKCKAINFVIGRVYADTKGGNAQIRSKLHIPRDLYNMFSEMTADIDNTKRHELHAVITKIYQHFLQFEKKQSELFTLPPNTKIEHTASSTVAEVLAKNDKDPVFDYLVEGKEICVRVLEYIKKLS